MKHGYPIVPFASVGAEECYEILIDSDEMRRSVIGPLLERLVPRPDEIPPIVRGIGPLPRPQRFYFAFGHPLETRPHSHEYADQAACLRLRDRVQRAIESRIAYLLRQRQRDPHRSLTARLLETGPKRRQRRPPTARPS
jgi:hypothetical protein